MGLSDLVIPTKTIELPSGSFDVRGLSLSEISYLVLNHRDIIESIFARMTGRDPDSIGIDDADQLGQELLMRAPQFAAEVIALASDGDFRSNVVVAKRLPTDAQILALDAIGRLTFTSEQTLKKVIECLIASMTGVKKAMQSL